MKTYTYKIYISFLLSLCFLAVPYIVHGQNEPEESTFVHPGGMYTKYQIATVRLRLGEEPWKSAYENLLRNAEKSLGRNPSPMADFKVPFYYGKPEEHTKAKVCLSDDSYAAIVLALAYQLSDGDRRHVYAEKSVEFLNGWAGTNEKVSDMDGNLVMSYAGVSLVHAADLLWEYDGWPEENREQFRTWVRDVFLESVSISKRGANNHGAWGEFASISAAHLLEDRELLSSDIERLKKRIETKIDSNGELPHENRRTTSGMWYTYFALSPMTGSANIIRNSTGIDLFYYIAPNGRSIRQALDKHFEYCLAPDTWPYAKENGSAGELQQLFNPSAEKVKIPKPSAWPNNLFEAMASVYKEEKWAEWVSRYRPINSGRGWVFPTLMTPGIEIIAD